MKKKQTDLELISNARMDIAIKLSPEIDHALLVASRCMRKNIPSGTARDGSGNERCVMCKRTVGMSAIYCKYCGQKLRDTSDWAFDSYRE